MLKMLLWSMMELHMWTNGYIIEIIIKHILTNLFAKLPKADRLHWNPNSFLFSVTLNSTGSKKKKKKSLDEKPILLGSFFFFLISILTGLLSAPCMFSRIRGELHQEMCIRMSAKHAIAIPAMLIIIDFRMSTTLWTARKVLLIHMLTAVVVWCP